MHSWRLVRRNRLGGRRGGRGAASVRVLHHTSRHHLVPSGDGRLCWESNHTAVSSGGRMVSRVGGAPSATHDHVGILARRCRESPTLTQPDVVLGDHEDHDDVQERDEGSKVKRSKLQLRQGEIRGEINANEHTPRFRPNPVTLPNTTSTQKVMWANCVAVLATPTNFSEPMRDRSESPPSRYAGHYTGIRGGGSSRVRAGLEPLPGDPPV